MKVGAFFKSGLGCQHFIFTFDHLTKKDTKQGHLSVLMSTSSSHYSLRVEDACGSMTEKKGTLFAQVLTAISGKPNGLSS